MVRHFQRGEMSREQFDRTYFGIMLPYVTPLELPNEFIDGDIHIPPYKLSNPTKNLFIKFFQVGRDARHFMLETNPELIPVLRQYVTLSRQKHINVTSGNTVLKVDGEIELFAAGAKEEAEPSSPPKKKMKLDNRSRSTDIDDKNKEIEHLEATIEQLKNDILKLKSLYVETSSDVLEKLEHKELSDINEQMLRNLIVINKVKRAKQIEEQNDKYGMSCILCYENRRNVVFRPCSHVLQCEKCPIPIECHVCKEKIQIANKIFL